LLYQIVVPFERVAQQLFYQIEEQEISFYEAAHLYDIDEKRRHQCGFERKLYRRSLNPNIATILSRARLKEVLGYYKLSRAIIFLRLKNSSLLSLFLSAIKNFSMICIVSGWKTS